MRRSALWVKVLICTNVIATTFLCIVSFHYQVPQKVLNKFGITKIEIVQNSYTYLDYRQNAIHSLVSGVNSYNIVMLGDSITECGNWNELLNRADIANFGISGDASSYLLYRLSDMYLAAPQKCFLMIGINDFAGNAAVEKVFHNYKLIVEDIKLHNIETIIQSTLYISKTASRFEHIGNNWQEINVKVDNLNELLREYCVKNNLIYLDINEVMSKNKMLEEVNTSDGVHLNKIGYEKWKKILLKEL
ncbi:MAG: hypothetical protein Ta2B_22180 [Termitinemataceae bacterium]|nr:MAG: hypothetical protein Ta2B_22180 [Termitinemataceae bacterium]